MPAVFIINITTYHAVCLFLADLQSAKAFHTILHVTRIINTAIIQADNWYAIFSSLAVLPIVYLSEYYLMVRKCFMLKPQKIAQYYTEISISPSHEVVLNVILSGISYFQAIAHTSQLNFCKNWDAFGFLL